jgi:hypothetical protein
MSFGNTRAPVWQIMCLCSRVHELHARYEPVLPASARLFLSPRPLVNWAATLLLAIDRQVLLQRDKAGIVDSCMGWCSKRIRQSAVVRIMNPCLLGINKGEGRGVGQAWMLTGNQLRHFDIRPWEAMGPRDPRVARGARSHRLIQMHTV